MLVFFSHVLDDNAVYRRVLDEIDHAWPDKDSEIPMSTLLI